MSKPKIITAGSRVTVESGYGWKTSQKERVTKINREFIWCGKEKFRRGSGWHIPQNGYYIYEIAVCMPPYRIAAYGRQPTHLNSYHPNDRLRWVSNALKLVKAYAH